MWMKNSWFLSWLQQVKKPKNILNFLTSNFKPFIKEIALCSTESTTSASYLLKIKRSFIE